MKVFAFLGGLICGAAFGGAAGLLLAPESGGSLKERFRQGYQHVIDEGKRAAAERRAELEARFAEAKRVTQ